MNTSKPEFRLSVLSLVATCLGFCACGNTARPNHADGGGDLGFGGNPADVARGTGGALGGTGGGGAVDAPLGSGGIGQTGGQPGSGGEVGSGGKSAAGGTSGSGGATRVGTGGTSLDGAAPDSAGGSDVVGGTGGAGGRNDVGGGTGGSSADGGPPGSGGKTGSGGRTGAGGGTGIDGGYANICGGFGPGCSAGEFCDVLDHCGASEDGIGECVPTGPTVGCDSVYQPVCGCNGKTYSNNCVRQAAGAGKFSDGECVAGRDAGADTNPKAALGWQAVAAGADAGPGIVVIGMGFYATDTDVPMSNLNSLIFDDAPSHGLSNAQLDDLFARLAAIDLDSLPHPDPSAAGCTASLLLKACLGCTMKTLSYASASQLVPEMEPVWAWFDEVLGSSTISTNPRNYCR
jgi:hypothetical protein